MRRSTSSPDPPRRTPSRSRRRRSRARARACARNSSSPSLSEIELTIPFPWIDCRPASRTLHFELSTITGSRATSGSVAITFRNVRIASSPSRRSASMFTSMKFAPPRTCSSATSTAAEVARLDQAAEARRARHVRALADEDEAGVGCDRERLEPAEAGSAPPWRDLPRGQSPGRGRNGPGVLRRRAAARADDVQEAVSGELVQQRRSDVGCLVITAERVRQPCVRMRRGKAVRDLRQLGDVGPHLTSPERAVDADDQRIGVLDRRPEAFDRLARQRPAGQIDDRRH